MVPLWLDITLRLLGTAVALLSVVAIPFGRMLWKHMRDISAKVERIYQHFDADSDLSASMHGTLPSRLGKAEEMLEVIERQLVDE